MGSMITLGIEEMEIEWGKNYNFTNHSKLFLSEDKNKIPYYYADSIIEIKDGYSSPLSSVKKRLDLLGYSLKSIENKYNQFLDELERFSIDVKIPFNLFYDVIYNMDIRKTNTVQWEKEFESFDLGEYARKCLLREPEIAKIMNLLEDERETYFYSDLESYVEGIDPYILIRIFAENPINNDLELQWRYSDVVEAGWVSKESIFEGLSTEDKILIVTEGSSDSFVIKRSIDSLYPYVADFFEFVDMKENYPFTGDGNLFNFLRGLISIRAQNNIIIIFDNDIAGNEKYFSALEIKAPNNIRVCKLPDCSEFDKFKTVGPSGSSIENINGKAVAIECFLDFDSVDHEPAIRWTSYSKKSNNYQGELIDKDEYVRAFKKSDLLNSTYNTEKIRKVIDHLIASWINN